MDLLLIGLGVLLLYFGGDALVKAAVALACQWGVKPMVVGLTVVALGTSTPELFASLLATLRGNTDIALGNVVGSNIANIGLILGVTALIAPIRTHARFLRREVPFMLGVAVVLQVLVVTGGVSRLAGGLLLAGVALYLVVLLRGGESSDVEEEFAQEYGESSEKSPARAWLRLGVGLLLLAGGAQLLIIGATGIARSLGVPELTIGLSLVALGTSLPELFASVVAAVRREPDIALGNIVGSNILNVLVVLGASALAGPLPVAADSGVVWDVGIMLTLSVLLLPFLITGLRLGRREATLLLLSYGGYVFYLYSS
ncbi:MAG: calcium/sodium antiporter [Trueperaceae bacterium]